jgi:transcription-repair coupling factor (superfamily II helicase)
MPEELINLFDYAKVRIKASYKGIKQIEIGDNYVKLIFNENIVPKKDDFDFKVKRVNLDLKTNEMFVYGIKDFKNYFNRILNIGEKENV